MIVKLIEKETVSKGGIVLTGPDAQEVSKGTVLAIGSQVESGFTTCCVSPRHPCPRRALQLAS